MRSFLFCLFFLLPFPASAAVSISEVAWMGSVDSANHEWIELQNDGANIDVTGWTLVDGMNLEIELAGTIPGNSHVVLERTSDASAPGTAFLIYTGALVNTGATLKLIRADGSLVDQVPGGEDWENIGGDNTTKETAQYTDKGWKTATPTPGSALVWNGEPDIDDETSSEPINQSESEEKESSKKRSDSGETVRLILPDVTLSLDIDAQEVGYVNQSISFDVEPFGIGKDLINSLQYEWNFGDGLVSLVKDTGHIFQYPGKYVVTVYAGFKRQEQVARHEITILPVMVSLTTNQAGDVQVNNDSPYEIDISGYRVKSDKAFAFPPRTIMLPYQTITIPKNKLGGTKTKLVGLYDAKSVMVASIIPGSLVKNDESRGELTSVLQPETVSFSSSAENQIPAVPVSDNFTFVSDRVEVEEALEQEVPGVASASTSQPMQLANVTNASEESESPWTHLALAGVMIIGVIGVLAVPKREKDD